MPLFPSFWHISHQNLDDESLASWKAGKPQSHAKYWKAMHDNQKLASSLTSSSLGWLRVYHISSRTCYNIISHLRDFPYISERRECLPRRWHAAFQLCSFPGKPTNIESLVRRLPFCWCSLLLAYLRQVYRRKERGKWPRKGHIHINRKLENCAFHVRNELGLYNPYMTTTYFLSKVRTQSEGRHMII